MAELFAPALEEPKSLKGEKALAEYLGLGVEAFRKWMSSPLWAKPFNDLLQDVVLPRQQRAKADGKPVTRSAGHKQIEAHIDVSESGGEQKFSAPSEFIDKEGWSEQDHYAYCLYRLRVLNKSNKNGVFFGKRLTDHQAFVRLWTVLKYAEHQNAESRRDRSVRKDPERRDDGDNSNSPVPKKRRVSGKDDLGLGPLDQHAGGVDDSQTVRFSPPRTGPLFPDTSSTGRGLGLGLTGITPSTPKSHTSLVDYSPQASPASPDENLGFRELESRIDLADPTAAAKLAAYENAREGKYSIVDTMLLERHSEEFDMADRWWKDYCLGEILTSFNEDDAMISPDELRVLDEAHAFENLLHLRSNMDAHNDDQTLLPFPEVTQEDFDASRANAELQDNRDFQPVNHLEACQWMGVDPDHPRFACMPPTMEFKFWQPVAIFYLEQKMHQLSGAMLCDQMGLGKTFTVLGLLMRYVIWRACEIEDGAGDDLPKPKPSIIIVPPYLIPQWVKEAKKVASGCLNIHVYYGDNPSPIFLSKDGKKNIKSLDRDHEIFKGENACRNVVITSTRMWDTRHGPTALKKWRKANGMSEQDAQENLAVPDTTWKHDLSRAFRYCPVDESQSMKNPASKQHIAVLWIQADMTILITATPEINSIYDIEGYAAFLRPRHNDPWSKEALDGWGLNGDDPDNVNPYELPDEHPACLFLRTTTRAVKRWILTGRRDITEVQKGEYLRAFHQACTIRRSHASVLQGKKIGDDIPPCKHRRAECPFTPAEQEQYDEYAKHHLANLVHKNAKGQTIFDWHHVRILSFLSSWLGWKKLHHLVTAKTIPDLLAKKDLLGWLLEKHSEAYGGKVPETPWGRLSVLFKGAPKLRALGRVVRSVCVRMQEKMVVVVAYPGNMVDVVSLFRELQIECEALHGGLSPAEKAELQRRFNEGTLMVLVGTFKGLAIGWNLQEACNWMWMQDPSPSDPIDESVASRLHRLGQQKAVNVVKAYVPGTFNDTIIQKTFRKALPATMAMMDSRIFQVDEKGRGLNDEVAADELQTSGWVLHQGTLLRDTDDRLAGLESFEVLRGLDVVKAILKLRSGVHVDVTGAPVVTKEKWVGFKTEPLPKTPRPSPALQQLPDFKAMPGALLGLGEYLTDSDE